MKYGVSKETLLFTAGIVWIVAGSNILRIGIVTWQDNSQFWLFKIGEAIVVFLLFFCFIFRKLLLKHTQRIGKKNEKNCPFSFFDIKGWIVMVVMVTFGIVARRFGWFPVPFIAVFYTGLSSALILTGFLFLYRGWKELRKKNV
ncbi:MAG: hypothetical protein PUB21_09050 [Bacteroidales bacterium]|nr:hypothetical protein [Bacteroidales bacterium]